MASLIASALCLGFVAYLFWSDPEESQATTPALWLPLLWMFFAGSRYLSAWLGLGSSASFSYDEGSPMDRAVFMTLIVAGIVVLSKRNMDWGLFFSNNKVLLVYFGYCLISATWSDDPYISFKRWFKDLGNPIMVLIVLTEPAPLQALAKLMRRLSYLLIPLSVLFVRYFPELGRAHTVDGMPMYTGVGHQKNALGQMCLVIGIYFAWQILQDRERYLRWTRSQRLGFLSLVVMLAWLLYMSNSQTLLACLLVAIGVLLCARLPFIRQSPSRLTDLSLFVALMYLTLETTFDIKNSIIALLGRDPSLTSRTDLWALLLSFSRDPMLGAGFMSFWSGERMEGIWAQLGTEVLQAHSGYIEQYLNLGYVGLTLTILILAQTFFKLRGQLSQEPSFSMLRLCFLYAAVLSNYTEASFYGISNMWIVLLLAVTERPALRARDQPLEATA